MSDSHVEYDVEPENEYDELPEEEELDEASAEFVHDLTLRLLDFVQGFCDVQLRNYQIPVAYSVIESILLGDGAEKTVVMARQVGKTEVMACLIAGLMVILPRLAKVYPLWCGKFAKGFHVGIFAPVEEQADTAFGRVVSFLSSDRAAEFYADPDLHDEISMGGARGKGKLVTLKVSKSLCRMQTANPKAKIEGKTYHFIYVDEAQEMDELVYTKSIRPMTSSVNGTVVLTGTAQMYKCYFLEAIQRNHRADSYRRGKRRDHFEVKWTVAAKENPEYKKYVKAEMIRLGEDSDAFRTSYLCEWILEKGMFLSPSRIDGLYDNRMPLIHQYWQSPIVVGIDVARSNDSTVATALFVDWDAVDSFGFYPVRVLNWLEINDVEWEDQYFKIIDFINNYDVYKIGVDAQGVGGAVAERLGRLLERRRIPVVAMGSDVKAQAARWNHLIQLIQRDKLRVPGHSKARRTKRWQRFNVQMGDLERVKRGPYLLAAAPEVKGAYDDFPDSLAIACALTMPEAEELSPVIVADNPFYRR